MAILTLNQVLKQIENFAEAHQQVNHYRFQQILDLNVSGVTHWPAMLVFPDGGRRAWNETMFRLDVYIVDRLITDLSNEQEILSDVVQIGEDLVAFLRHPTLQAAGLFLRDSSEPNFDTFVESTPDNVAGIMIPLEISIEKPDDRCSIPAPGLSPDSGSSGSGSCPSVTIYNIATNMPIATVPAGQSYGVTVLTEIVDDPDLNTTTIIDPLT